MKKKTSALLLCGLLVAQTFLFSGCGECDHDWDDWEIEEEPTCTEKGLKVRECNECGEEQEKDIDALGHTEKDMKDVDATCEKEGSEGGVKCKVCDEILEEPEKIAKIEHSYVESITTEALCNAAGTKEFKCENCEDSYSEEYNLPIYTGTEIHEKAKTSVGEVSTFDKKGNGLSLGSAFAYTADGQFVTNYHVIEGAYSAKINVNGKSYDITSVVAYDKDIDLAIIKVTTSDTFTVLPLCQIEHATGAVIYALGSSQGFTDTFSQGIITNSRREEAGVVSIQHSASISSGNSGGPLINEYGEIIGINTWIYVGSGGVAQNLNFAVAVEEIANLTTVNYTMAQLYEAECDPYKILKEYIIAKGTYDYEDNEYYLALSSNSSGGYQYITSIYYKAEGDYFRYSYYFGNNSYYSCMFIDIDKDFSGKYEWAYIDNYQNIMVGTLTAQTYTSNSSPTVTNYQMKTSNYSTIYTMSKSMLQNQITRLKYDFTNLGFTASDFGFVNY